jgi:anthranilate synthase component 1
MYHPTREEFKRRSKEGNLIPVYREILADMETPVSAFYKIGRESRYAFLLESVEGGEHLARYSFLGSDPSTIFKARSTDVQIIENGAERRVTGVSNPLDVLEELMGRYRPVYDETLPRFYGGAVGYIGYEMVKFFDDISLKCIDGLEIPDSVFLLTDTILIFDHVRHKIKVVSNVAAEGDADAAYDEAVAKVEAIIDKLREPVPRREGGHSEGKREGKSIEVESNFTKERFEKAVEKCKDYIRAGDAFQIVLSQRFSAPLRSDPFDVYRALRAVNPSPYMYYLQFDDVNIAGSSPEILVRVEGDVVESRPIAGTRPRGRNQAEDETLIEELLGDPKERAEHIMLVDLGRNDVGRVCDYGTVKVTELMAIEKYSHVMHIVSNIVGKLRAGCNQFDVLKACFPVGTVSGAPKIRAMEIIDELEPTRRGPYAGAVGYFSFSGNLDTCITIRTIVMTGGRAYMQAGAGLVADSVPENEYYETVNKARHSLRALELAEAGLDS